MVEKFDANLWAETQARSTTRCLTCQAECEVDGLSMLGCIRIVLTARAEGRSGVSQAQLHRLLVDKFNYPYGATAIRNHMIKCEADLWEQTWGCNG